MYYSGQDEKLVLTSMFSSDHRGTNVISGNQSRELAVNSPILYCWKILSEVLL